MIVIIRSLVMIIIQAVEPVWGGGGAKCLETMNLSILPVCNSHLSVLSQKYASFIAAFLEIDCFCLLSIVSSFSQIHYH